MRLVQMICLKHLTIIFAVMKSVYREVFLL